MQITFSNLFVNRHGRTLAARKKLSPWQSFNQSESLYRVTQLSHISIFISVPHLYFFFYFSGVNPSQSGGYRMAHKTTLEDLKFHPVLGTLCGN